LEASGFVAGLEGRRIYVVSFHRVLDSADEKAGRAARMRFCSVFDAYAAMNPSRQLG
jgi:hypothetical protein